MTEEQRHHCLTGSNVPWVL